MLRACCMITFLCVWELIWIHMLARTYRSQQVTPSGSHWPGHVWHSLCCFLAWLSYCSKGDPYTPIRRAADPGRNKCSYRYNYANNTNCHSYLHASLNRKVHHPNLITYLGLEKLEDGMAILSPLVKGRNLHDHVFGTMRRVRRRIRTMVCDI